MKQKTTISEFFRMTHTTLSLNSSERDDLRELARLVFLAHSSGVAEEDKGRAMQMLAYILPTLQTKYLAEKESK